LRIPKAIVACLERAIGNRQSHRVGARQHNPLLQARGGELVPADSKHLAREVESDDRARRSGAMGGGLDGQVAGAVQTSSKRSEPVSRSSRMARRRHRRSIPR
jgi:hypothetical protein